jgi:hypothetical protein
MCHNFGKTAPSQQANNYSLACSSTSMYSRMGADSTRREAANPDGAGIVGHNDLKGVISEHENK